MIIIKVKQHYSTDGVIQWSSLHTQVSSVAQASKTSVTDFVYHHTFTLKHTKTLRFPNAHPGQVSISWSAPESESRSAAPWLLHQEIDCWTITAANDVAAKWQWKKEEDGKVTKQGRGVEDVSIVT